jgi:serine/threonine protein kinase
MDRLYGTLENKIEQWEEAMAITKGCCGMSNQKDPAVKELLQERLLVAYDLCSAFTYLHGLRCVL